MKMLVSVVLLLSVVTAGKLAKKPEITLTVTPKSAISTPYRPASFRLTLTILNGGEELWCPEVRWEWPNDTVSKEEGDCDPYEDASPRTRERQSWTKTVTLPPGEWIIRASIAKTGHVIRKESVTVTVSG